VEPPPKKPPFDLTLVRSVKRTVVLTPFASCTTKVSASMSRLVTTPLTFIFWPLATLRELALLLLLGWLLPLVSWAKAAEANAKMTVRAMVDTWTLFDLFTLIVFFLPLNLSYKILDCCCCSCAACASKMPVRYLVLRET
jgi:hypothetical protein